MVQWNMDTIQTKKDHFLYKPLGHCQIQMRPTEFGRNNYLQD